MLHPQFSSFQFILYNKSYKDLVYKTYNCYTPSLPHLFQHFCLVLKLLLFPPHPVQAKVRHSLVSWSHLNLVWDPEQVPVSSGKLQESIRWCFLTPSSLLSFRTSSGWCTSSSQCRSHSDMLKKLLPFPEHPPYWNLKWRSWKPDGHA